MEKIAMIGGGNFGANAALYLAESNLCDIVLVDDKKGLARGKALDLMEAAPARGFAVAVTGTDDLAAIEGARVVVVAAGVSRKAGVAGRDLFQDNLEIMRRILTEVKQRTPEAIVIIQREPTAALVWRAIHELGFKQEQVIGLTGLAETARFRYFMARELGVSPIDATALVIGGPGRRLVPLIQYANVSGIPLTELLSSSRIERITSLSRQTEDEILNLLRLVPAYYTPAAALAGLVGAIVRNRRRYLPVTVLARGQYGLENVCVALPALIGGRGVEKILELELTTQQKADLRQAAEQLNAQPV